LYKFVLILCWGSWIKISSQLHKDILDPYGILMSFKSMLILKAMSIWSIFGPFLHRFWMDSKLTKLIQFHSILDQFFHLNFILLDQFHIHFIQFWINFISISFNFGSISSQFHSFGSISSPFHSILIDVLIWYIHFV
jgi:hypothetical protein